MSLVNKIGEIIKKFIHEKYNEYLKNERLLMIDNEKLPTIIGNMYNQNIKNLKILIREQLKHDMGGEYPSGSVENILLDLFQDREININRMVMEIDEYQKKNYYEIVTELEKDKNLGINLSIDKQLCICYINGIQDNCQLPNKEIIEKYKYLYSINGILLKGESDYIVKILRDNIGQDRSTNNVKLGLYGLYNDRI